MQTATAPLTSPQSVNIGSYRLNSIDFLRGLVMIIMALDHTRDFIHIGANTDNPLNLETTTPALFFTRWITHFCAPVFVFLSGTSIYLQSLRKSRNELSRFLLTRGLWLIFAELVIITFGISFDISYSFLILQVIWAIGISMVLMALLIRIPFPALVGLGFIILLGHNALDYWESQQNGQFSILYSILHRQNFIPLNNGPVLGVIYPFVPWLGIMILGYCFGKLYSPADRNRHKTAIITGVVLTAAFILLRFINSYGDPQHWSPQNTAMKSVFSFLDTQKYPPSLLYSCMTLGPALIVLGLMGNVRNRFTDFVTIYGRVPFFYYVLHFYLIHIVSLVFFISRGHSWEEGAKGLPGFPFKFVQPGEGLSLGFTYLVWIGIVLALYPLCKWFSDYKKTHRQWWLSYV
jgi:uncharacterized membrane protein